MELTKEDLAYFQLSIQTGLGGLEEAEEKESYLEEKRRQNLEDLEDLKDFRTGTRRIGGPFRVSTVARMAWPTLGSQRTRAEQEKIHRGAHRAASLHHQRQSEHLSSLSLCRPGRCRDTVS